MIALRYAEENMTMYEPLRHNTGAWRTDRGTNRHKFCIKPASTTIVYKSS